MDGRVAVAAGGFLGRFPEPGPVLLAWRDHHEHPPYTPEEIAAILAG